MGEQSKASIKKKQPSTSIGMWDQLAAYDQIGYRERYKIHMEWECAEVVHIGGNHNPNFLNHKITEQDMLNE